MPFTRLLLLLSGWIAVVLATLGVVLPLLPTTPFLLLAAWCFSRSSPRFHHWLLYRSWFGGYIRHWQEHKGLPRKAKRRAVIVILVTFAVSLWLVKLIYIRLLLLLILACLLIFMLRLPETEEMPPQHPAASEEKPGKPED
ncbi:DUF454 family protein [Morganella psychrotolerans]|uniref:Inner membrane protein n=1 Tax=Morganella psychrotolerans TaxID=368603 RepID=A0A1B8HU36_9GAMM|nr:DUF454 family protein [Morganella psychrotolerans]OBU13393.1 hypothetical protein AYY18_01215 [Morganella psychrotolerans]